MPLAYLASEILHVIAGCLKVHDINALVRTSRHLHKCLNLYLHHHSVQCQSGETWCFRESTFQTDRIRSLLNEWPSAGVPVEVYFRGNSHLISNPLYYAIQWGHEEIARQFVEVKPYQWQSGPKATPILLEAIRHNRWTIVQLLIEIGVDINEKGPMHNYWECTPLYLASWCGHVQTAQLLLDEGADPEVIDHHGRKPRSWAIAPEPYSHSKWGQIGGLSEMVQIVRLLLDDVTSWGEVAEFVKRRPQFESPFDAKLVCLLERDPTNEYGVTFWPRTYPAL